jgi:hypothetical protein
VLRVWQVAGRSLTPAGVLHCSRSPPASRRCSRRCHHCHRCTHEPQLAAAWTTASNTSAAQPRTQLYSTLQQSSCLKTVCLGPCASRWALAVQRRVSAVGYVHLRCAQLSCAARLYSCVAVWSPLRIGSSVLTSDDAIILARRWHLQTRPCCTTYVTAVCSGRSWQRCEASSCSGHRPLLTLRRACLRCWTQVGGSAHALYACLRMPSGTLQMSSIPTCIGCSHFIQLSRVIGSAPAGPAS